ncbi:uncharacterized protein LOC131163084 isoform X1 [Malania oleifera]|uniref:uncharacterized protein LOC131163084 isoform X1 n=1 Tax=Malania oleifera TaxID=397392 RepID=UPI0025ADD22E|nr:uncharacterized protein LOC131163084 isoform X1 [Malania oleifera]
MEDYIINMVVFGVVSWTTAFLLVRKIFPKRSFDFCSRIVSTTHASLAVALAIISVEDWTCSLCDLASRSSRQQVYALKYLNLLLFLVNNLSFINGYLDFKYMVTKQAQTLAVSMAYLIYDLVCCAFHKKVELDNLIHHSVGIVGIWAALSYDLRGSGTVVTLCVAEVSTPFLHLREILKELGYRDTDLNLAADILFAVIFSFARMVIGPFLTYAMLSTSCNPPLLKAMALGLQLISAFWFYKIVRMVKHKLFKRIPPKTITSSYHIQTK